MEATARLLAALRILVEHTPEGHTDITSPRQFHGYKGGPVCPSCISSPFRCCIGRKPHRLLEKPSYSTRCLQQPKEGGIDRGVLVQALRMDNGKYSEPAVLSSCSRSRTRTTVCIASTSTILRPTRRRCTHFWMRLPTWRITTKKVTWRNGTLSSATTAVCWMPPSFPTCSKKRRKRLRRRLMMWSRPSRNSSASGYGFAVTRRIASMHQESGRFVNAWTCSWRECWS